METTRFRRARAACAVLLAGAVGLGGPLVAATGGGALPGAAAAATAVEDGSILAGFQSPSVDAKLMARMWFPDAAAGADQEGLALVRKQIEDMAAGGFGGVEVAFIADSVSYTNADMKEYGYGSANWKNIVKELLTTANAIEGGFKVDFTITSHWPPIVNTIDPNDPQASQESAVAYTKLTEEALAAGSVDVPAAEHLTEDTLGAPFAFANSFESASVGVVTSLEGGEPTFELATLTDVTGATSKKKVSAADAHSGTPYIVEDGVRYAGQAAGVPDETYAAEHGIDYDEVVEAFGPEPSDPDFDGKIDDEGNRERMADWEYSYVTDLDGVDALDGYEPSAGEDLAVGDYVLFGNYRHGTGQVLSGFPTSEPTQYNRPYVTNYFSSEGAEAVFDFWDANILDDEVVALLKENGQLGTSIFEDSIEAHFDTPAWTGDLIDEVSAVSGTSVTSYAPALMDRDLTFDDSTGVTRLREDYNLTLGELYEEEHAAPIKEWALSFGYTYRAQGYALTGLDIGAAAAALDVPEGDNSSAGDGLRQLSGAVNLTDKKMLSMESVTFSANMNSPWATVQKELNSDFADGVNRSILHGSAFARSFNRVGSAWPGWNFVCCGLSMGFTSMNSRQVWWDEVTDFSNYVARNQAVMQGGEAKIDLAVLVGSDAGYSLQSGNTLQQLLNQGYNYNLVSEPLLEQEAAVVEDGILAPDGPGYQALIVKGASKLSVATVEKLQSYADAGLPIVLFDSELERVYGTSHGDNTDQALAAAFAALQSEETVTTAPTQKEVRALLKANDVTPAASASIVGLETNHRADESGDYYYLYNADTSAAISGQVALRGTGTPYLLDATTGAVTPVAQYTRSGDRVSIDLELASRQSAIIALIDDTDGLSEAPEVPAVSTTGGTVITENGQLVLRTTETGDYAVTLADDSTVDVSARAPDSPIDLSGGWDLGLESWGPDEEANEVDPTLSAKVTTTFEDVDLGQWTALPATEDQLAELGVDSMAEVSGSGTYSRSFNLPASWSDTDGYELTLQHGNGDNVTRVTVNGQDIDAVDQLTNVVDVGDLLQAGTNTIEIQIDTSLGHRSGTSASQTYGLTGIEISPYVDTVLAADEPVDPEPVVNTRKPSIGGKAKIGRKLTARPGRWSPAAESVAFQWLRDGKAIKGATGKKYLVRKADRGHRLKVRVTVSVAGYESASATSTAVRVKRR